MFTDVSDMHAFKDAINCIAYYGITNGTGDGSTYSPNQDVTRAEMAVFIARAAGAAGVDLGDAMSAGFTDIGDVWAEAQDAINRLASKGVIASGGAYRPDDAVTRAEMASFLIGLLNKAAPNVTVSSRRADHPAGHGAWRPNGRPTTTSLTLALLCPPPTTPRSRRCMSWASPRAPARLRCRTTPRRSAGLSTTSLTAPSTVARWLRSSLGLWLTPRRVPRASPRSTTATEVVVSARDENFAPKSPVS